MVNKYNISFFCRICGLKQSDPPWGYDGKTPTFEFCPCCGVEFGYQDCQLSAIIKYRKSWLQSGANWSEPNERANNWSLEDQLKNIPTEFK